MLIKDTLQRDPATHPLVNQGQARVTGQSDERTWDELRAELSTFVCEGQYEEGLVRILSSYLGNLQHTSQKGAWISGFYGSGKSHLVKMLCHLWQNTEFPDGSTARSLVPTLPSEVLALLKELDGAGKRGGGLFAAAGAMPSGSTDKVRLTILGLVLRSAGLPELWPQAQFSLWLIKEGHVNTVKAAVAAAGKNWDSELNDLYVSPIISKAILECDPNFAASEAEARKTIKAQFPPATGDITTVQFMETLKRVLLLMGRGDKMPCTVIVLDEVQQYIGGSTERSSLVSEAAEAISKELGGLAIVVGAGQSALNDSKDLQRLMDRFTIRVPLSDTDVEVVTRKVLLQKKASAIKPVRELLDKYAGEVSRQLSGTRIAEASEDHLVAVEDYPLLPVRRRFWEHCFRQVDLPGTSSQLRSQLRIIHDAVRRLSDRPLGTVIPADELFDQLAPDMVNSGALLREINDRIINLRVSKGPLASRLCGLVFLIGKLPRGSGVDIGVRAKADHLADLITDDLTADNGTLRSEVNRVLKELAAEGVLMEVGGEYRLQTKEGSDWDQECKNRRIKFSNTVADLQHKHDQLLYGEFDRAVRGVKVTQGRAREVRKFTIHRDDTQPAITGESIPLWVRDQWSCSEKEHLAAAQKAGLISPLVFAFIPKRFADELKEAIIDAEASDQTINLRGIPSTAEGMEARHSMESRRDLAVRKRDELIRLVVTETKIFQAGGSELLQDSLDGRLKDAADAALVRLYPNYSVADALATEWENVRKRASSGDDHPFQPIGYSGATEQHPVAQEVMRVIGAGKTGAEVRKVLEIAPYGWPRDAVDSTLMALQRSQHLSATMNGASIAPGQLNQNLIPKAEFHREHVTIGASERIAIRSLFQVAGVSCKSGEELVRAPAFVAEISALLASSGGQAPFPPAPDVPRWGAIQKETGNAQLLSILGLKDVLEKGIPEWGNRAEVIGQRSIGWEVVNKLAHQARHLESAVELFHQLEQIRTSRLLLEPADPSEAVRVSLTALLRGALNDLQSQHESVYGGAIKHLESTEIWQQLEDSERRRILTEVALVRPSAPDVSDGSAILRSLDSRSLQVREAEIAAISGRAESALRSAALYLEPKVQSMTMERATLRTEADIKAWLNRQEVKLRDALKRGPVLVN